MDFKFLKLLLMAVLFLPTGSLCANVDVLAVETFLTRSESVEESLPYVINLESLPAMLAALRLKHFNKLGGKLLYYLKVRVNGVIYYRLSFGNFANRRLAQQSLNQLKRYYPKAWIGKRTSREKKLLQDRLDLAGKTIATQPKPATPVSEVSSAVPKREVSDKREITLTDKLERQAREEFLNQNYLRVIKITDKLFEIGDQQQRQKAMELAALARERQFKFAQAIAIYQQFLDLYPESKVTPRITARLEGLKTMDSSPRQRIAVNDQSGQEPEWDIRTGLSQFYRNDSIDRGELDNESVNQALVTDLDVYAQKKNGNETTTVRFDGGVVNDLIDDETDSRISRAMVDYTNTAAGYALIGGRQSRTAKGVYSRFDGLVYQGLSHSSFDYSLHGGFIVESSLDSPNFDRRFIGASIKILPLEDLEIDAYLLHQESFGLIDRQAIGTEFQLRSERGFIYGVIDYDTFYGDLNNVTATTNYQYDDQWTLNLTYDYRNYPLLTTTNAIQGQDSETLEELMNLFTNQEIYQLADDSTSKSHNLFAGVSYQVDIKRQLDLSLSYISIEATEASGDVLEVPASDNMYINTDYSVRGYFYSDDFTSLGIRLADTSSAQNVSFRVRTNFPGFGGMRYDPRIKLDYRKSHTSDIEQWILSPSMRMTYQYGRNMSLAASFGIEYSNFDLPDQDDQTIYALFLGYVYQF
ncbi:MAG: hypothetical protein GY820_27495 [Gammaproteobacteria bacterium]|nr:hypothetical protein [Gammaproteobacteria bacterium]